MGLWNFLWSAFWPGLRDDATAIFQVLQLSVWNLAGWCTKTWNTLLFIFHNRLGPGPSDDVAVLILKGLQLPAWNLVGWCTVSWIRLLPEMAMLGQVWAFHGTLQFSMIGLARKTKMEWPHAANVRIFWSRRAEGAVALLTSCLILSNCSKRKKKKITATAIPSGRRRTWDFYYNNGRATHRDNS